MKMGNYILCLWPTNFKTDAARLKAVETHHKVEPSKYSKCLIKIKYKSCDYQKVVSKLKYLEEQNNSDFLSSEDCSSLKKRLAKPPKIYSPIMSDDDDLPCPPNYEIFEISCVKTRPEKTYLELAKTTTCNCAINTGLLKELFLKIERLQDNVSDLMMRTYFSYTDDTLVEENDSNIKICGSYEELLNLNENLADQGYFNKAVEKFSLLGGRDVIDSTRKILCKVVSNSVAKQCNWLGRNNKHPFVKMENISKFILVTVRKNPLAKTATKHEIENVIKIWLRNAADRDGGWAERKNRTTESIM